MTPLIEITPLGERRAEWDAFVRQEPAATFCHQSAWAEVMSSVHGLRCDFIVAEHGGTWRGVLPLVHVKGLAGHYLVSLPFVDDGGPVGDAEACAALASAAQAIAARGRVKLLELRSREIVPGPLASAARKVSVQLALPATVEELWEKTFKAKLRSQIRRPSKEGMVASSGPAELRSFYEVFARNMRDLGTPVQPFSFFAAQLRAFGSEVVVTVVRTKDGIPTAASFAFVWRNEMYVTWASSLREFNKLSPNMLLYSSMMEQAIGRGLTTFNFGRSTPGAPTHKFKQQWGGLDVPLPWAYWSPTGGSSTPTPDKPIFRIATTLWSKLPVPVTKVVGPILARQLP